MSSAETAGPATTAIPDVPDALVGWRAWVLGRSDGLEPELISPVRRDAWPARRAAVATCREHRHEPPASGCGCGLYAVTEPGRMMGVAADRGVIGCTALWGDVVEGTHGWRASRAYPRMLIVDPGVGARALGRLRDRYDVPIHRSELPLPELVGLLDTVLRDQADGLRAGTTRWSDLQPELRRQAALLEAARTAERTRLAAEDAAHRLATAQRRERQQALADAGKVVGLQGAVPIGLALLYGVVLQAGLGTVPWLATLLGVVVGLIVLGAIGIGDEGLEFLTFHWRPAARWLAGPAAVLAVVQAVAATLLMVLGWQPWSWVLVAGPAVTVAVCWAAVRSTPVPSAPPPRARPAPPRARPAPPRSSRGRPGGGRPSRRRRTVAGAR